MGKAQHWYDLTEDDDEDEEFEIEDCLEEPVVVGDEVLDEEFDDDDE